MEARGKPRDAMGSPFTTSLHHAGLTLDLAGGKATNLGVLARAGFPVPAAFVVTTTAYQRFVTANHIEHGAARAATAAGGSGASIDETSAAIRASFHDAPMLVEIAEAIRAAYDALGAPPVAVRSSATAEDLPDLSFAGQQDTFLHVVGHAAVLDAVVRCWSSLWTARAIAYRNRNGVAHDAASLAVVVQEMIESEASGVLFTANPLTGARSEHVIEATLGLGDALVSGIVEPDRYVVAAGGRLTSKTLGPKAVVVRGLASGGTATAAGEASGLQALPDSAILELSALGTRVAREFGAPQDIEWAWAHNTTYLLQSRPITSLYPLPNGVDPSPLQVFISIGAIQGMLDPFTPFGRSLFQLGAARVASLASPGLTMHSQRLLLEAGGRLFANVTGLLCNTHTQPVVRRALAMVEPGIARAMDTVLADRQLGPSHDPLPIRAAVPVLPFAVRLIGNASCHVLWPEAGRRRIERAIARAVAAFEAECAAARTLKDRLSLCQSLFSAVTRFGPVLMPGLAVGIGNLRTLQLMTREVSDSEQKVLEITRGLPHNVTTEMDLALWHTAMAIQRDTAAALHVSSTEVDTLAEHWQGQLLPPAAQTAIDDFMLRYGMRGVAEIDIGRSRWREDPRLVLHALKSYLQISDPETAPDAVFRRGAASANRTIDNLANDARRARLGWIRARLVRWAAKRVRSLAGLRESPKFTVIRLLGLLRSALLASGAQLVAKGALTKPDDLFFLEFEEVHALASGDERDWRALVASRRAEYAKEQRRRQIPLLMLSDGVAHYAAANDASASAGTVLEGTPVSPGLVEGTVRVVRDPQLACLEPGEILVCPGTDPAWTPLFLSAGGLITEVGGLMTHGSVVAREYGIPALVGVPGATTQLTTGMRVRLDGGRGIVTVLQS